MEFINNVFTIIGYATVILGFIELLFNVIPKFGEFRTKVWTKLAEYFKHKSLQKKAIAHNIEETVNDTVLHLKKELPSGWINKASIEWVKSSNSSSIKDGDIILRMKPIDSQDFNLLNGVHYFFSNTLFPNTSEIIPSSIKKAATLQISKRTISKKKPYLNDKFKTDILDPEINNDPTIANYFGRYQTIDQCGYFTGTFIREVDYTADFSRYNELRTRIEQEVNEILTHLIEFKEGYESNEPMEEDIWIRDGAASKYSLILVARPNHGSFKPYLRRAKERLGLGVERLYIMGCNAEKRFVRRVIRAIDLIPEYKLIEIFDLHKDYRGENNGICALFELVQDN